MGEGERSDDGVACAWACSWATQARALGEECVAGRGRGNFGSGGECRR
jgi:hypothetical protein